MHTHHKGTLHKGTHKVIHKGTHNKGTLHSMLLSMGLHHHNSLNNNKVLVSWKDVWLPYAVAACWMHASDENSKICSRTIEDIINHPWQRNKRKKEKKKGKKMKTMNGNIGIKCS